MDKIIEIVFFRSLWVWILLSGGFISFQHAIKKKNVDIQVMEQKMERLGRQKDLMLEQKEELMARIASQSDPAWIELVLMQKLGVVPDGQIKVHFTSDE